MPDDLDTLSGPELAQWLKLGFDLPDRHRERLRKWRQADALARAAREVVEMKRREEQAAAWHGFAWGRQARTEVA